MTKYSRYRQAKWLRWPKYLTSVLSEYVRLALMVALFLLALMVVL